MDLSLGALLSMVRDTLSDPRGMARRVMAVDLSLRDRWMALAFTAVASTVLFHVSLTLLPADVARPLVPPLATLAAQGGLMVAAVFLIWRIGAVRGGRGSLPEAVSLIAWLQFVLLTLQVVQIIAEVILPPLAVFLGLAGMVLFLWLLTLFVAELHGFRSAGLVFAAIIGVMFLLGLILALVLAPWLNLPA